MSKYIDEAKKFYEEAVIELERGKKENNTILIRDAGEKAWNAVLQATNALIESRGMSIPTSHHERRKKILEIARIEHKIREKGIRDRYMAREQSLHEDCFYDGIFTLSLLEEDIQKVKKYIEDIEELCNAQKR
ncbi:MAG: PaREP1 family protein [Methanosarcinales archaeon]